ncbi:MAG: sigma-70 family RNA polymerase sigma factor [Acidobacteria bacterium]|nr:sigma-70 family RNA polymerase sigma factor [Acidobacteriota bacterium]
MIHGKNSLPHGKQLHPLHPVELFHLCAADRENTGAWSEFLNRYAGRIKHFIRGTIRQFQGSNAGLNDSIFSGSMQESDLFQNTIIRLVENNCAAMKRFSGKTENELLAYLAVISRSTVLDALRRLKALKRLPTNDRDEKLTPGASLHSRRNTDNPGFERMILADELVSMIYRGIQAHSGRTSERDRLVFELHFFEDLSFGQISRCESINLSKAGVEKILKRLVSRAQEALHPVKLR